MGRGMQVAESLPRKSWSIHLTPPMAHWHLLAGAGDLFMDDRIDALIERLAL